MIRQTIDNWFTLYAFHYRSFETDEQKQFVVYRAAQSAIISELTVM